MRKPLTFVLTLILTQLAILSAFAQSHIPSEEEAAAMLKAAEEKALADPDAVAEDQSDMFPFVITYDAVDNASSMAHILAAPSGKDGFIRTDGKGNFVNDAGVIRFNATNITGPANFPSHENAEKMARRLARLGINCVRLHFMDTWYVNFMIRPTQGILADDSVTQRNLDQGQLDKLDYMISQFRKNGIYVNLNLHVGRTLDPRDGFPACSWANKGFGQFVPGMIELQKEYAHDLLTHVNPYTGHPYTDEPTIAMIEITNEDSFQNGWFSGGYASADPFYKDELNRQWNAWLNKKYATADDLRKAWGTEGRNEPLWNEQVTGGAFDDDSALKSRRFYAAPGPGKCEAKAEDGVLKFSVTKPGDEFSPKLYQKVSVKAKKLYTLSLKIRRTVGSGPWTFSFAVVDLSHGFETLGLCEQIQVGSEWKTITRSFVATKSVENALIQFTRFKPGEYEIDDVSFQAGGNVTDPTENYPAEPMPTFFPGMNVPAAAMDDFGHFLEDTECAYWDTMYNYIKKDLKTKSLVYGTQLGYSGEHVQARMDLVDIHGYWQHPRGGWISLYAEQPWSSGNTSMVNTLGNIMHIGSHRVDGYPYTISEYNHPYPNQYGAEAQPMLAIFGRLQNWSGIFQYTYNHYVDSWEPQANPWCFFDLVARTEALAHFPACGAAFIRGDIAQAQKSIVVKPDMEKYYENRLARRAITIGTAPLDNQYIAMDQVSLSVKGDGLTPDQLPPALGTQKVITSDTGEITWNREIPGKAFLAANSPNTKFFTGFPEGRTIDWGALTLTVGKTRLNWATVSLTSRFGNGFDGKNGKVTALLAATGNTGNAGRTMKPMGEGSITLPYRGHAPVMAEGIPAQLTLAAPAEKVKVFALDPNGDRKAEVPVQKTETGCVFEIGPQYKTVWYEIEVNE
ncbi:MAG: cellulase family glycosylhydrolase [Thermoguttaceae bacterium]|nr:cellulase family glycosylhydrolase [Thermoguttaceae bacterium]